MFTENSKRPSTSGTSGLGLIVIDVQGRLIEALPQGRYILQRCCFAAQAAACYGLPTFITEQVPDKLGPTHPDLAAAVPATVFTKTAFSAWQADGLQQAVAAQAIRHLLIAGIETSICIYQTVMDILRESFAVTVLTDCISAMRSEDDLAVRSYLEGRTPATLPAETLFYQILGDANHPGFSSLNRLVKKYRMLA